MLVPLLLDLGSVSGTVNPGLPGGTSCIWAYPNYAAFRTTLQQLIDGDDISSSSISTNILDLMVSMGEKRLYRDVRSSTMDTTLAITTTNNSAQLPVDLLELRSVYVALGRPATYMAYEQLQGRLQLCPTTRNKTAFYSFESDNLIFYPSLADGTLISGRYWKYFCSIVTEGLSGNSFFARYPELFLYAALAESGPYIGEVARLPEWKQRYVELVQDVRDFEIQRMRGGSKLSTRVA
jgi:hypothetical protein